MHSGVKNVGRAVRSEGGFTLIELLVSMAILLLVLTVITDAFISGTQAETSASNRVQVQVDARLAMSKMRDDLHCAVAAPAIAANTDALGNITGFSLALTEKPNLCRGVGATTSAPYVKWCTVKSSSGTSYALYRTVEQTSTPSCDTSRASFELTDIVQPQGGWPTSTLASCAANCNGNIWPDARTCPTGPHFLATQGLEIAVNPDPPGSPAETYELDDNIALRNSQPCGYTAASLLQFAWWPTNKTAGQSIGPSEIPFDISGGDNPAGTVTITAFTGATPPSDCSTGGTVVGSATVNGNGLYQFSGSSFPVSGTTTYWWYASYDGDVNNTAEGTECDGSTNMPHTTVNSTPQPSLTSLSVSPTSGVTTSTVVTLTASVTASPSGAGPTGTVNFYYATGASAPSGCGGGSWTATSPASATLTGGQGAITLTPSSAATYWWCAAYQGDGSFLTSSSSPVSRVVTLAPDTFGISSIASSKTAGSAFTVATITANLPGGGTDTSYTGSKCLTFTDPSNSPGGQTPTYPTNGTCAAGESKITFASGIATNVSITLVDAQSTTLTAKDTHGVNGTISGQSNAFTVIAGAVSTYVLGNPGAQMAGTSFNVTVTAHDAYGNTANDNGSYTVSWAGANNAPNGQSPTYASTTLSFASGLAQASGFKFYKATSTTLQLTKGGNSYTSTFTVNGGAGTSLSLTGPLTQTAGTAFSVTLTSLDTWGNTSSDSSTHTISWSGAGTAPDGATPTYGSTSVNFSNGTATVGGFTFDKAETLTLKATEGSNNYSTSVTVNPGAATAINWSGASVATGTLTPTGACLTTCTWSSAGNSKTLTTSVIAYDAHKNPVNGVGITFTVGTKGNWTNTAMNTQANGVTLSNAFKTANGNGSNSWSTDSAIASLTSNPAVSITISITP
jgi:prepilin-type N-terminal cleavage/methylation domain-containing protein